MGLEHISCGSGNARYIEVKKKTMAEHVKKSVTSSDEGKSPGTSVIYCLPVFVLYGV